MKQSLVLDLDETLLSTSVLPPPGVHYRVRVNRRFLYIRFRQGLKDFLNEVAKQFELYIFTSQPMRVAVQIIDLISREIIEIPKTNRFYREDCIIENGYYVKDLTLIRKDTENIFLVDDIQGSAQRQPQCLVKAKPWLGFDDSDNELQETIIPALNQMRGKSARLQAVNHVSQFLVADTIFGLNYIFNV
ncbi:NLI interacting factor-like phosphatase family protein [Tritrichomonas foetus]|uniref:Mitochondrial import inner membrane translocase subunit TIM50 n=1 Tax=Tritrichomonas foetus TaxID=1144522 RepID=A0A1J4JDQ6_9EUKA|nr:NLI interacting factor-like phosphatase family protein [Tritrichomonas foetus]|eukprot:OHS96423.1 NLI interacting factor-like phosphatase family protein [Tritrichomonas foetus]